MERSAYTHGFRRVYAAAAGVLAVGAILALLAGELREALVGPEFRQSDQWQAPLPGPTALPIDKQTETAIAEPVRQEPSQPEAVATEDRECPTPPPQAGKVLKGFGWGVHPIFGDWRYHGGLDLEAEPGKTVTAARTGRVTAVYTDSRYGLTVVVRNGPYMAYYGSLSEAVVVAGSTVRAGAPIGTIGQCPTEPYPHLHWAVKQDDQTIDPDR